jgi:hypothetical protein
MVLQNNNDHGFLSNQSLAGLPVGTMNLGGPGSVNFNNFAGDQFFTIAITTPVITGVQLVSGGTRIQLDVQGLVTGSTYRVADSLTLDSFTDIEGSEFVADAVTRTILLPVTPGSVPFRFFRVRDLP